MRDIVDFMLSLPKGSLKALIYDHACGVAKHLRTRAPDFLTDEGRLTESGDTPAGSQGPLLLIPKFHLSNHKEVDCLTRRNLNLSKQYNDLNGEVAEQDNMKVKHTNYFLSQYSLLRHIFLVNAVDVLKNIAKVKSLKAKIVSR